VDTFKQAAQIWAGMPDDEKKAYTEEYKVRRRTNRQKRYSSKRRQQIALCGCCV